MKHFTISDVEHYSGIKAHTLRIWEQRNGIPRPQRINGHARSYTLTEFNLILNIAVLNKSGIKISHLSRLSESALLIELKHLENCESKYRLAVNELIIAMFTMDTGQFEIILDKCFTVWPTHTVFNQVIYCFLKMTGLLWQGSRLTEEHLVVTILRKKLLWGIENAGSTFSVSNRVLLFLPDTKQLDLGLLYMQYHLRYHGMQVIYMGNDVSISNLKVASENIKPDYYYTYLSRQNKFDLDSLGTYLHVHFPGIKLMVTAPDAIINSLHSNIIQKTFDEAMLYFYNLQQAQPQAV